MFEKNRNSVYIQNNKYFKTHRHRQILSMSVSVDIYRANRLEVILTPISKIKFYLIGNDTNK